MTQAQDKDDAQWLAALAGQPDATNDTGANMQADALRRALQAQSSRMNNFVPLADDAQYQQLLFRLRREGLNGRGGAWTNAVQWGRITGQMAARVIAEHNTIAWIIAVTAVLVIAIAFQITQSQQGQGSNQVRDSLRSQGTVLAVSNPTVRAAELAAGLKATGTEPTIVTGPEGRVQMRFKSSTASLDYLSTQRIEPMVFDGYVTLTLTEPGK